MTEKYYHIAYKGKRVKRQLAQLKKLLENSMEIRLTDGEVLGIALGTTIRKYEKEAK